MRILLSTIWNVANYGALLQCYGLSSWLLKNGHEVYLTDCKLSNTPRILKTIKSATIHRKINKFHEFLPKVIDHNDFEADIYITGSDQVWNPDILGDCIYHFMLDYAPAESIKIAYSASFGKDKWTDVNRFNRAAELIKKYRTITVREDSGIKILKDQFDVNASQVLDPCFLINDFSSIMDKSLIGTESNELVSYKLVHTDEWYIGLKQLAKQKKCNLKELKGRRIHNIRELREFNVNICSVRTWLEKIAGAKYVVTDSFHGAVFSILFHKQFVVIPAHPERATRIISLLHQFGLDDRLGTSISNCSDLLDQKIDYKKIDGILKILLVNSESVLRSMLSLK